MISEKVSAFGTAQQYRPKPWQGLASHKAHTETTRVDPGLVNPGFYSIWEGHGGFSSIVFESTGAVSIATPVQLYYIYTCINSIQLMFIDPGSIWIARCTRSLLESNSTTAAPRRFLHQEHRAFPRSPNRWCNGCPLCPLHDQWK